MKIEMKVSSYLLVESLASSLYEDVGQQVMELLRNGAVACMPNPDVWEPNKVRLEVSLVPNHPLAEKSTAAVFLDYGSGITDAGFDRYFRWLGTPYKYVNKSSTGAAQKGVGRIAALSLNEKCVVKDYEVQRRNGYYILSRTSKSGPVRFVPVKPMMSDEDGFEIDRWIDPTSTEMGNLKGITGSFTAIVIPNCVFKTHEEIYEAIKWLLPREKDKMLNLKIGGKLVESPPLENTINKTSPDGKYRARIGVAKGERAGIWLCDQETAFRVASCQGLARHLPEPLWFPDLAGDIFLPGVLGHQNTARNTLHKEFLKSNKTWREFMLFLVKNVVPDAKALIERDPISGDAAKTLDDLVEMFTEKYGEPPTHEREKRPKTSKPDTPPEDTGGGQTETKERDPYKRHVSIMVRNKVFLLYRGRSLDPYRFAEVNPEDRRMILVNVRGNYKALPSEMRARREHCLMQILQSIGEAQDMDDPIAYANEIRSELK